MPADGSAGWVLLLPGPRAGTRVLCLELDGVRNAESLAYWHERVTALTANAAASSITEFTVGAADSGVPSDWRPGRPLPFAAHTFDLVVCRLGGGDGTSLDSLPGLLLECARVATERATLYLDLPNPLSYQRVGAWMRGRRSAAPRGGSRRSAERALRRAGFDTLLSHAFTTERGEIADVIPRRGYRPTRNSWSPAERVKRLLLSRGLARIFAGAFGIVAQRGAADATLLELLAKHASLAADAPFDSCFVNPGKTFVRFGGSMFVVPAQATVVARRRLEVRVLAQLRASGLALSRLAPKIAREFELAGRPAFEFEALDGATIDAPTADFDALVGRAYDLLCEFDRESLRRVSVGAPEFAALAGNALESAQRWYPELAQRLDRLGARLRERLMGATLPVVWIHGDYKLENLIIDEGTRQVHAVIDWELGAPLGLPLTDLYYLLCYRRVTSGDVDDVLDCVAPQLVAQDWTESEKAMLAKYLKLLDLDAGFTALAVSCYVLQHIGLRYRYDAQARDRLESVLGSLETLWAPGAAS